MTCKYSNTDWLDVLYNSVRKTPGGVVDAALFLTERRGRGIHPESLRAKLRAVNGDEISISMAEMLSEWMEEKVGGSEYAWDWLLVMNAQRGIHVDYVPPAPIGGWEDECKALQEKFLLISVEMGKIAAVTTEAVADGKIHQAEADRLVPLYRDTRVLLHRAERNTLRAVEKER
ncbi:MAG: hypothetical protein ACTJHY_07795 [Alcaligenes pakistanensis]